MITTAYITPHIIAPHDQIITFMKNVILLYPKIDFVCDQHFYIAWDRTATIGSTSDCYCNTSHNENDKRKVMVDAINGNINNMNNISRNGIIVSIGEFSHATYNISSVADRTEETLKTMFKTQIEQCNHNNIECFFWTWKMPYGGCHQDAWSLEYFVDKYV